MKINKEKIKRFLITAAFFLIGFAMFLPLYSFQIRLLVLLLLLFGYTVHLENLIVEIVKILKGMDEYIIWVDKEYYKLGQTLHEEIQVIGNALFKYLDVGDKEKIKEMEMLIHRDSPYHKIKEDFEKIRGEFNQGQCDLRTMKSHFNFLLWLIPVALAIFAILIKQ